MRQADFQQLVFIQFFHVMEIDPVQFFNIEDSGILRYPVQAELLAEFFHGENFLIAVRRPSQKSQEIVNSLGQVSQVAILLDAGCAVAFAHFLLIFAQDKRYMGKGRYGKAQCFIEDELARCIGQMFFRTDDMGNMHESIIHDDTIIIYRNSV